MLNGLCAFKIQYWCSGESKAFCHGFEGLCESGMQKQVAKRQLWIAGKALNNRNAEYFIH